MKLLCCVLMGETQLSVATYPNQTCDLRRSCTYTFLVFPPAATQTNRHTYRQTDRQIDRQRVTSHCSARIRFVLHGPRFRHFTSQFHCLLTAMGSTQHSCLSVPLLFLGISFFLRSLYILLLLSCIPSYLIFLSFLSLFTRFLNFLLFSFSLCFSPSLFFPFFLSQSLCAFFSRVQSNLHAVRKAMRLIVMKSICPH